MNHLVSVTSRILAPGVILGSGMALLMSAPASALLTALGAIAGVVVLPVAMVVAASIAQNWWLRRLSSAGQFTTTSARADTVGGDRLS